ncbi:glycosylphosphatidylinositol anchor biosynthesis [Fusarium falciforme]
MPSIQAAAPPPSSLDRARNQRNRPVFLRDIFVIRLINAWWIATFFQPDEFFQSLEPAWDLAFGPRSGAWLTWEWQHQLRSSLHPALFAGAYLAADFIASHVLPMGILRAAILVAAPRTLQAGIAALGDWYTWQLAVSIYGDNSNVSFFALFLQLFNPWQWYCSTRTFSNSLEMTLTVMALYYWPWELLGAAQTTKENPKPVPVLRNLWSLRASLCLAAFAVILRPTNILIWATIALVALTRISLQGSSPLTPSTVLVLLREAILCGSLVLAVSITSDRLYFGFWTFPPLQLPLLQPLQVPCRLLWPEPLALLPLSGTSPYLHHQSPICAPRFVQAKCSHRLSEPAQRSQDAGVYRLYYYWRSLSHLPQGGPLHLSPPPSAQHSRRSICRCLLHLTARSHYQQPPSSPSNPQQILSPRCPGRKHLPRRLPLLSPPACSSQCPLVPPP